MQENDKKGLPANPIEKQLKLAQDQIDIVESVFNLKSYDEALKQMDVMKTALSHFSKIMADLKKNPEMQEKIGKDYDQKTIDATDLSTLIVSEHAELKGKISKLEKACKELDAKITQFAPNVKGKVEDWDKKYFAGDTPNFQGLTLVTFESVLKDHKELLANYGNPPNSSFAQKINKQINEIKIAMGNQLKDEIASAPDYEQLANIKGVVQRNGLSDNQIIRKQAFSLHDKMRKTEIENQRQIDSQGIKETITDLIQKLDRINRNYQGLASLIDDFHQDIDARNTTLEQRDQITLLINNIETKFDAEMVRTDLSFGEKFALFFDVQQKINRIQLQVGMENFNQPINDHLFDQIQVKYIDEIKTLQGLSSLELLKSDRFSHIQAASTFLANAKLEIENDIPKEIDKRFKLKTDDLPDPLKSPHKLEGWSKSVIGAKNEYTNIFFTEVDARNLPEAEKKKIKESFTTRLQAIMEWKLVTPGEEKKAEAYFNVEIRRYRTNLTFVSQIATRLERIYDFKNAFANLVNNAKVQKKEDKKELKANFKKEMQSIADNSMLNAKEKADRLDKIMGNYAAIYGKISINLFKSYQNIHAKLVENIANQLMNESRNLFAKLDLTEFTKNPKLASDIIESKTSKAIAQSAMPTFQNFSEFSTKITNNVKHSILENRDTQAAVLAAKRWVEIAAQCFKNGDLYTTFAIVAGVSGAGKIAKLLEQQFPDHAKVLEKISGASYKNLQVINICDALDKKLDSPVIPPSNSFGQQFVKLVSENADDPDRVKAKNLITTDVKRFVDKAKLSSGQVVTHSLMSTVKESDLINAGQIVSKVYTDTIDGLKVFDVTKKLLKQNQIKQAMNQNQIKQTMKQNLGLKSIETICDNPNEYEPSQKKEQVENVMTPREETHVQFAIPPASPRTVNTEVNSPRVPEPAIQNLQKSSIEETKKESIDVTTANPTVKHPEDFRDMKESHWNNYWKLFDEKKQKSDMDSAKIHVEVCKELGIKADPKSLERYQFVAEQKDNIQDFRRIFQLAAATQPGFVQKATWPLIWKNVGKNFPNLKEPQRSEFEDSNKYDEAIKKYNGEVAKEFLNLQLSDAEVLQIYKNAFVEAGMFSATIDKNLLDAHHLAKSQDSDYGKAFQKIIEVKVKIANKPDETKNIPLNKLKYFNNIDEKVMTAISDKYANQFPNEVEGFKNGLNVMRNLYTEYQNAVKENPDPVVALTQLTTLLNEDNRFQQLTTIYQCYEVLNRHESTLQPEERIPGFPSQGELIGAIQVMAGSEPALKDLKEEYDDIKDTANSQRYGALLEKYKDIGGRTNDHLARFNLEENLLIKSGMSQPGIRKITIAASDEVRSAAINARLKIIGPVARKAAIGAIPLNPEEKELLSTGLPNLVKMLDQKICQQSKNLEGNLENKLKMFNGLLAVLAVAKSEKIPVELSDALKTTIKAIVEANKPIENAEARAQGNNVFEANRLKIDIKESAEKLTKKIDSTLEEKVKQKESVQTAPTSDISQPARARRGRQDVANSASLEKAQTAVALASLLPLEQKIQAFLSKDVKDIIPKDNMEFLDNFREHINRYSQNTYGFLNKSPSSMSLFELYEDNNSLKALREEGGELENYKFGGERGVQSVGIAEARYIAIIASMMLSKLEEKVAEVKGYNDLKGLRSCANQVQNMGQAFIMQSEIHQIFEKLDALDKKYAGEKKILDELKSDKNQLEGGKGLLKRGKEYNTSTDNINKELESVISSSNVSAENCISLMSTKINDKLKSLVLQDFEKRDIIKMINQIGNLINLERVRTGNKNYCPNNFEDFLFTLDDLAKKDKSFGEQVNKFKNSFKLSVEILLDNKDKFPLAYSQFRAFAKKELAFENIAFMEAYEDYQNTPNVPKDIKDQKLKNIHDKFLKKDAPQKLSYANLFEKNQAVQLENAANGLPSKALMEETAQEVKGSLDDLYSRFPGVDRGVGIITDQNESLTASPQVMSSRFANIPPPIDIKQEEEQAEIEIQAQAKDTTTLRKDIVMEDISNLNKALDKLDNTLNNTREDRERHDELEGEREAVADLYDTVQDFNDNNDVELNDIGAAVSEKLQFVQIEIENREANAPATAATAAPLPDVPQPVAEPQAQQSDYSIHVSDETLAKVAAYKTAVENGEIKMGAYLKDEIKNTGKSVKEMTNTEFYECIIKTKKPNFFAESELVGNGTDWNQSEISILGDTSFFVPNVTVFDDGKSHNVKVYKPEDRFQSNVFFVNGALLQVGSKSREAGVITADSQEVLTTLPDGKREINDDKFYQLYERRLLPILIAANNDAASKGKKAFITMQTLGGALFAGEEFKGVVPEKSQASLEKLLLTHGDKFKNIQTIYYDPFDQLKNKREKINGIDFMVRPLTKPRGEKFNNSQLCKPSEYAENDIDKKNFENCEHYTVVASDHVAWPGNDAYKLKRDSDEGRKASATNVIARFLQKFFNSTNTEYHEYTRMFRPKRTEQEAKDKIPVKSWEDKINEGGIKLDPQNKINVVQHQTGEAKPVRGNHIFFNQLHDEDIKFQKQIGEKDLALSKKILLHMTLGYNKFKNFIGKTPLSSQSLPSILRMTKFPKKSSVSSYKTNPETLKVNPSFPKESNLYLTRIPEKNADIPKDVKLVVSVVKRGELALFDFDYQKLQKEGVKHVLLVMEDFNNKVSLPLAANAIFEMHQAMKNGEGVLVHCKAGRARSGMIVSSLYAKAAIDYINVLTNREERERFEKDNPHFREFIEYIFKAKLHPVNEKISVEQAVQYTIEFVKEKRPQLSVNSQKLETLVQIVNMLEGKTLDAWVSPEGRNEFNQKFMGTLKAEHDITQMYGYKSLDQFGIKNPKFSQQIDKLLETICANANDRDAVNKLIEDFKTAVKVLPDSSALLTVVKNFSTELNQNFDMRNRSEIAELDKMQISLGRYFEKFTALKNSPTMYTDFVNFCKKIHVEENIAFIEAVEDFQKHPTPEKWNMIYKQFLEPDKLDHYHTIFKGSDWIEKDGIVVCKQEFKTDKALNAWLDDKARAPYLQGLNYVTTINPSTVTITFPKGFFPDLTDQTPVNLSDVQMKPLLDFNEKINANGANVEQLLEQIDFKPAVDHIAGLIMTDTFERQYIEHKRQKLKEADLEEEAEEEIDTLSDKRQEQEKLDMTDLDTKTDIEVEKAVQERLEVEEREAEEGVFELHTIDADEDDDGLESEGEGQLISDLVAGLEEDNQKEMDNFLQKLSNMLPNQYQAKMLEITDRFQNYQTQQKLSKQDKINIRTLQNEYLKALVTAVQNGDITDPQTLREAKNHPIVDFDKPFMGQTGLRRSINSVIDNFESVQKYSNSSRMRLAASLNVEQRLIAILSANMRQGIGAELPKVENVEFNTRPRTVSVDETTQINQDFLQALDKFENSKSIEDWNEITDKYINPSLSVTPSISEELKKKFLIMDHAINTETFEGLEHEAEMYGDMVMSAEFFTPKDLLKQARSEIAYPKLEAGEKIQQDNRHYYNKYADQLSKVRNLKEAVDMYHNLIQEISTLQKQMTSEIKKQFGDVIALIRKNEKINNFIAASKFSNLESKTILIDKIKNIANGKEMVSIPFMMEMQTRFLAFQLKQQDVDALMNNNNIIETIYVSIKDNDNKVQRVAIQSINECMEMIQSKFEENMREAVAYFDREKQKQTVSEKTDPQESIQKKEQAPVNIQPEKIQEYQNRLDELNKQKKQLEGLEIDEHAHELVIIANGFGMLANEVAKNTNYDQHAQLAQIHQLAEVGKQAISSAIENGIAQNVSIEPEANFLSINQDANNLSHVKIDRSTPIITWVMNETGDKLKPLDVEEKESGAPKFIQNGEKFNYIPPDIEFPQATEQQNNMVKLMVNKVIEDLGAKKIEDLDIHGNDKKLVNLANHFAEKRFKELKIENENASSPKPPSPHLDSGMKL